jgi:hypothetical protein
MNITRKPQRQLSLYRILVLYWVAEHLESGGKGFFEDMQLILQSRELTQLYFEETVKVVKCNQKRQDKKKYKYPTVEDYYW